MNGDRVHSTSFTTFDTHDTGGDVLFRYPNCFLGDGFVVSDQLLDGCKTGYPRCTGWISELCRIYLRICLPASQRNLSWPIGFNYSLGAYHLCLGVFDELYGFAASRFHSAISTRVGGESF